LTQALEVSKKVNPGARIALDELKADTVLKHRQPVLV